jgi:hypothetical protein
MNIKRKSALMILSIIVSFLVGVADANAQVYMVYCERPGGGIEIHKGACPPGTWWRGDVPTD